MARYLETARKLHDAIEKFAKRLNLTNEDIADLGLIANLAVRCCPRACQSTVRRNIIAEAVKGHCNVSMNKVRDEKTGFEFNAISIIPIGAKNDPVLSKTVTEAADAAEGDE